MEKIESQSSSEKIVCLIKGKIIPVAIFLFGFAIYLFSSAPALAPYRDMGEMVSVSHTLGVAHPPGYPTYTLLGKISTLIPLSNQSYRLNLLSVFGGAFSGCLLYFILLNLGIPLWGSLLSVFLWLTASGVWTVSIVTEMYSLNLAAGMCLLFLWIDGLQDKFDEKKVYLVSFLGGLFSGIRLDIVLWGPAFLFSFFLLLLKNRMKKELLRMVMIASLFFIFGFGIYLYLMVRSAQKPLLNWNRPETIQRLWGSITRKTHGGTLDLLSENYAPGELFGTNMKLYFKDVGKQFHWIGIPLAFLGFWHIFRKNRLIYIFTFTAWCFSGPYFIYKANMPPNTHAYSVLEAHFLLPNIMVMIWIAYGLYFLEQNWISKLELGKSKLAQKFFAVILSVFILADVVYGFYYSSKRNNYFGYDYGRHVLNTLPENAVLVMQKDVQLFLFWAMRYAERKREDITIVAKGLAGSPWYIKMREDEKCPVTMGPIRNENDFERFLNDNSDRQVFVGWEEEVPFSSKYRQIPVGLLRKIELNHGSSSSLFLSPPDFLKELYVYRGKKYDYQAQNEFFSSDIIDDYSKAHFARGVEFSLLKNQAKAREEWNRALSLNSENPSIYYRRAFSYYEENQLIPAMRDFVWSEHFFEKTFELTKEYHSLPDVVRGVQAEWGEVLLNMGVVYEKQGETEKSENAYLRSLKVNPDSARGHYNLAVLYWNRDWRKVVDHLQSSLKIDPSNQQARSYLDKAIYALEKSQGAR